jgi:antitoxin CptB
MLELDLILGRFLESGYAQLDAAERECFSRLLEMPDAELHDWVAGKSEPPDPEMREILMKVL